MKGPLTGLPLHQIGYVVRDLDAAIERYRDAWGVGTWTVRRHDPTTTPAQTYDNAPAGFAMRLALSATDPVIELIEPLAGPNAYESWLDEHGDSIHHFGFVVPSLATITDAMEDAGYPLVQSGAGYGLDGDGAYGYFDTTADLRVYTELIEAPARRTPPEDVR